MEKKEKVKQEVAPETPEVLEETAVDPTPENPAPEVEEMPEAEVIEEPAEESAPGNPLVEKVKQYFPDEEINESNVNEYALKTIDRLSAIQDNLIEVSDEFPEFAAMLDDVLNGMFPDESIARNFGEEVLNAPEGSPDRERISKAKEERKTKLSERKERMSTLEKNRDISVENAQKFIADTGMEEEQAKEFIEWFDKLNADMFNGLISPEHFSALHKAFTHDSKLAEKDSEMEQAVKAAEARGRNQQIEKKKINAESGDGVPKLATSGKSASRPKSFGASFMEEVF
jgi:hypothetical protein